MVGRCTRPAIATLATRGVRSLVSIAGIRTMVAACGETVLTGGAVKTAKSMRTKDGHTFHHGK